MRDFRYRLAEFRWGGSGFLHQYWEMLHFKRRLQRQQKLLRARELRACPTPTEAAAWNLLRRCHIHGLRFRRQHVLEGFILDFYCPSRKVAIEIDGEVHTEPDQGSYDLARDAVLAQRGITVIRIRNADISEQRLRSALEPFAHPPPHRS